MITQSVHLMTIRGIRIGVHYSWLMVCPRDVLPDRAVRGPTSGMEP
jgi:hypothetical protein